jgi:hypothetical protein
MTLKIVQLPLRRLNWMYEFRICTFMNVAFGDSCNINFKMNTRYFHLVACAVLDYALWVTLEFTRYGLIAVSVTRAVWSPRGSPPDISTINSLVSGPLTNQKLSRHRKKHIVTLLFPNIYFTCLSCDAYTNLCLIIDLFSNFLSTV